MSRRSDATIEQSTVSRENHAEFAWLRSSTYTYTLVWPWRTIYDWRAPREHPSLKLVPEHRAAVLAHDNFSRIRGNPWTRGLFGLLAQLLITIRGTSSARVYVNASRASTRRHCAWKYAIPEAGESRKRKRKPTVSVRVAKRGSRNARRNFIPSLLAPVLSSRSTLHSARVR